MSGSSTKPIVKESSSSSTSSPDISTGSVEGVAYYHCPATTPQSGVIHNIVLLHGKAFTKENWKESGILQQFCAVDSIQVTALDLNVKVDAKELQKMLTALSAANLVTSLPITALVTPSASGSAVVDWMQSSDAATSLPQMVSTWIPVASNSLLNVQDTTTIAAMKDWPSFHILAIYGDQDGPGKESSQLLGNLAGATVQELPGKHPVYLDSPDAFVTTILRQLKISKHESDEH